MKVCFSTNLIGTTKKSVRLIVESAKEVFCNIKTIDRQVASSLDRPSLLSSVGYHKFI